MPLAARLLVVCSRGFASDITGRGSIRVPESTSALL